MKIRFCIMAAFLSVLLFFSNISVKANDVVFPAFPEPVEGKSSTHYLITFNSETDTYYLLQPLDPQEMSVIPQDGDPIIRFNTYAILYHWQCGEGATSWEKVSEYNYLKDLGFESDFLYSSFDLYYSNGELFFQKAPIKVSFLTQMKKVEMGAVMETVAKMIPVVMIAVVGFLGFRKAFNLLLKVLHQG